MKSSHPYNLDGRPAPPRCVVWRSSLPADAHAAAVLLDEDDRARCATYARSADRARFVGGRVLARRAVAADLGCEPHEVRLAARCTVCGGPHGRPRVLGLGEGLLNLSIAHAGERVLVAVARGCAVGVDVERIGPFEDLATAEAGVLAAAERAVLAALPASARGAAFFGYWTRKEALLKATGQGLAIEPATVHVTPPGDPAALLAGPPPLVPERVHLRDLDAGAGYAACLALLCDGDPAVVEDATPMAWGAG
jgi:4'-phosphopantetheinyl transferase